MLVLNKLLQRTGIPTDIRFCQIRYTQSEEISTLLNKKTSVENLVKKHFNIPIRKANSINEAVIRVKVLEH